MKQYLFYFSVAIFSIFIGSQITEGVLLVPYWQSLPAADFYSYYNEFGPSIGKFYTVLTIIAALIPIAISLYCKKSNSGGFTFALISSLLSILFVSTFYIYFKGVNELFFEAAFSEVELKNELVTWARWHWGRILIECLALVFLVLAFGRINGTRDSSLD